MATINPSDAKQYVPGEGGGIVGTIIPTQATTAPPGTTLDPNATAADTPSTMTNPLTRPPIISPVIPTAPRGLDEVRTEGVEISPSQTSSVLQENIDAYNSTIVAEQVDVAALAAQYNGLIENLKGQYRFAETAEEKQRLKYMLADIEAQYDAARQTITQTYDLSMTNLRNRIGTEQAQVEDFAARGAQAFTTLADEMEARGADVSNELAQKFQGIGLEEEARVANEWSNLVRSMAPVQGSYLLALGNVRVNSMNQTLDSMAMEAMAQQGELERQKAATESITKLRYLEQVESRINQELADFRDKKVSIEMTRIAQTQSAIEFNARMSQDARNRMRTAGDPRERYDSYLAYARGEGGNLVDPVLFEQQFIASSGGERPDDTIWWAFLESGAQTAETVFNDASLRRIEAWNAALDNQIILPNGQPNPAFAGNPMSRVYFDELQAAEREFVEAQAQFEEFKSLMQELSPFSYSYMFPEAP